MTTTTTEADQLAADLDTARQAGVVAYNVGRPNVWHEDPTMIRLVPARLRGMAATEAVTRAFSDAWEDNARHDRARDHVAAYIAVRNEYAVRMASIANDLDALTRLAQATDLDFDTLPGGYPFRTDLAEFAARVRAAAAATDEHLADLDTSHPASSQHYIETGAFMTATEVREYNPDPEREYGCLVCDYGTDDLGTLHEHHSSAHTRAEFDAATA